MAISLGIYPIFRQTHILTTYYIILCYSYIYTMFSTTRLSLTLFQFFRCSVPASRAGGPQEPRSASCCCAPSAPWRSCQPWHRLRKSKTATNAFFIYIYVYIYIYIRQNPGVARIYIYIHVYIYIYRCTCIWENSCVYIYILTFNHKYKHTLHSNMAKEKSLFIVYFPTRASIWRGLSTATFDYLITHAYKPSCLQ